MTTPFPFVSGAVLTAAQMNDITNLPINDQTASYSLVVGDAGKRVVMDVATANTVTVDDDIFSVGDTIFIANKGEGPVTLTEGSGVDINTAGSLVIAQHGGGTLVATSASVFTFFSGAGNPYGVATLSGSGAQSDPITVSSVAYTLLTAINDGTLTVSKAGLFDCLLVGGGGTGGGGEGGFGTGGGGGGGGVVIQTVFLAAGSYTVDIGAGGSIGNTVTANTGKTTAIEAAARTFTLAAVGGGIGDYRTSAFRLFRPTLGGSSGGCGNSNSATSPAVSTQGHLGGTGGSSGSYAGGGGGGGGAGSAGANGVSNVGGAGGAGVEVNTFISGASTFKGGGGGGGGNGGNGANGSGNGSNNTGGGGQGRGTSANADGTVGFSGIAYIRFKI